MKVRYRGTTWEVPHDVTTETVGELKRRAAGELGVDVEPATLRAVARGKTLSDGTPLEDVGNYTTVMLLGATEQERASVREKEAQLVKVAANKVARVRYSSLAAARPQEEHVFGSIRVLDSFPDKDEARALLEQLAHDPGVLAVMRAHRWRVGVLSEMYPDGKVGVDPVCVLGLNENKGAEIKLRIRTDDLRGFRRFLRSAAAPVAAFHLFLTPLFHYRSIKKVLFHELAHNEHSEHNDDFYRLMLQVERECDASDWRQSRGRTLTGIGSGTRGHVHRGFETGHETVDAVVGTHVVGAPTDANIQMVTRPVGTVQRLGGAHNRAHSAQPRVLAAEAALRRAVPPPPVASSGAEAGSGSEGDGQDSGGEVAGEGAGNAPMQEEVAVSTPPSSPPGPTEAMSEEEDEEAEAEVPADAAPAPTSPPPTAPTAAPVSASGPVSDDDDPGAALARRVSAQAATLPQQVLDTLARALTNALQRGGADPKFLRLRASNAAVQRRILAVPAATQVLEAAGWRKEPASGDLALPARYDPSRLYIVLSVLQAHTEPAGSGAG